MAVAGERAVCGILAGKRALGGVKNEPRGMRKSHTNSNFVPTNFIILFSSKLKVRSDGGKGCGVGACYSGRVTRAYVCFVTVLRDVVVAGQRGEPVPVVPQHIPTASLDRSVESGAPNLPSAYP